VSQFSVINWERGACQRTAAPTLRRIIEFLGYDPLPAGTIIPERLRAKRRFRELYVAELTMVEDRNVEGQMVALAQAVDPELANLTDAQKAALGLARALKAGYTNSHAK